MRRPPCPEPGPWQSAEHQKSRAGGQCREIDQQQRRTAVRIADQIIAPGQARDDDDRQRNQADGAIDENRIGRRSPSGAAARDQPEPHRIAADRGGQRLVEEASDHVVSASPAGSSATRRIPPRVRAIASAPASTCRKVTATASAEPAEARQIDRETSVGEVDLAQREVQQRRRDQDLENRKQDLAHRIRASSDVVGSRRKTAQPGAARRTSPLWYGFKADLAIAAQTGIATPSAQWVKRLEGRRAGPRRWLWGQDVGSGNFGHGRGRLHRLSHRAPAAGRGPRRRRPRQSQRLLRSRAEAGAARTPARRSALQFRAGRLADRAAIAELFARHRFAVVVHLAAQAGVRYSIEHPEAYVEVESHVLGSNFKKAFCSLARSHVRCADLP